MLHQADYLWRLLDTNFQDNYSCSRPRVFDLHNTDFEWSRRRTCLIFKILTFLDTGHFIFSKKSATPFLINSTISPPFPRCCPYWSIFWKKVSTLPPLHHHALLKIMETLILELSLLNTFGGNCVDAIVHALWHTGDVLRKSLYYRTIAELLSQFIRRPSWNCDQCLGSKLPTNPDSGG